MAGEETYKIPVPLQNIGCQDLLEYKCSHCGWLRKQRTLLNQLLSWPQAYVVLHEGCLYYFKTEKAKSPSGKFSLYGYNSVYRASEIPFKTAPWSFKIVHSHEEFKTYYFSASSEREMKMWMSCIKKEMIQANGGSALYSTKSCSENSSLTSYQLKLAKEKAELEGKLDDSSFYNDVETNIYDGVHKFVLSKDYQQQCSVKRQNDESDDEDLIDKRPPQPLPDDKLPFCSYPHVEEIAPPTNIQNNILCPSTPPRPKKPVPREKQHTLEVSKNVKALTADLKNAIGSKKSPRLKRRGSYEDEVGILTQLPSDHHVDFRQMRSSDGGSTGEEDPIPDLEEYWASIHFDYKDKQRAQDIINAIGEDGVYLVRPENTGTGKVLVVYSDDKAKKYRIQTSPEGEYFLANNGFHDKSLENLLCYYYQTELPTVNTKLKTPYKLHKTYKNLKL